MGYFSNGTEGELWERDNCDQCVHGPDFFFGEVEDRGCPVMGLQLEVNYEAANDKAHVVHRFIPLRADGLGNEPCRMFVARSGR